MPTFVTYGCYNTVRRNVCYYVLSALLRVCSYIASLASALTGCQWQPAVTAPARCPAASHVEPSRSPGDTDTANKNLDSRGFRSMLGPSRVTLAATAWCTVHPYCKQYIPHVWAGAPAARPTAGAPGGDVPQWKYWVSTLISTLTCRSAPKGGAGAGARDPAPPRHCRRPPTPRAPPRAPQPDGVRGDPGGPGGGRHGGRRARLRGVVRHLPRHRRPVPPLLRRRPPRQDLPQVLRAPAVRRGGTGRAPGPGFEPGLRW